MVSCIFVNTNEDKNHSLKELKKITDFSEKKFESLSNLILKYYNNPQLLKLNSIDIKSKFKKKFLIGKIELKLKEIYYSIKFFRYLKISDFGLIK